jgi:hypothetical protein
MNLNETITIPGKRGVKLPLGALIEAIPAAAKAWQEKAADDQAPESDGGTKITAKEVMEDVGAFLASLAEHAAPAVLQANGLG